MTFSTATSSSAGSRPDVARPKVGFLGGFGVGNLGNDASLQACIDLVWRVVPNAEITVFCPQPSVVQERLQVDATTIRARRPTGRLFRTRAGRVAQLPLRLLDVGRALRKAGQLDVLLVPGTGILDDYGGEQPYGWPMTLCVWMAAARARGTRTGMVAIGAGPLDHPVSRRLTRWVVSLVDRTSVRDTASLDFLVGIGCRLPADVVVPDVVFSLRAPSADQPRHQPSQVSVVVMKYRGWVYDGRSTSIAESHVRETASFCSWLLRQGYRVQLVTAGADDGPATERVRQETCTSAPELALEHLSIREAHNLEELMHLVANSTAVVATRYHSVIAALLVGRPTISLGYADKNAQLMDRMGLAAYCQHVEQIDQAVLRQQFEKLVADHEAVTDRVTSSVGRFTDQLKQEELALGEVLLGPTATTVEPGNR
jgi:polysaccharide pyruvyl transferase WcaK-like protein